MNEPKARPIMYTVAMAQKVHDGLKSQTRRVVKPQPLDLDAPWPNSVSHVTFSDLLGHTEYYVSCGWCPYGKPGDHLWVKETYHQGIGPEWGKNHILYNEGKIPGWCLPGETGIQPDLKQFRKKSGLFMPKWASRTTTQIDSIRLEKLNDISREDCIKEGIQWSPGQRSEPMIDFVILWDSINKKDFPWNSNPWVWVIDFHVV